MPIGLEGEIVDQNVYQRTLDSFKKSGVRLPQISELADPSSIAADITAGLSSIDSDAPDAGNLFRVHWHNTLIQSDNNSLTPQTITLKRYREGWFVTNVNFYQAPSFCK